MPHSIPNAPRLEPLEDRCVPATAVLLEKGFLAILGDDNANVVRVRRESGQLVVEVTEAGKMTRHRLGVGLVSHFLFRGEKGNDRLDLEVSVAGQVQLRGGPDANSMRLWGPQITGNLEYIGGDQADSLIVGGDVVGDVTFQGNKGNDYLEYRRAVIKGSTAFLGGDGHDRLDHSIATVIGQVIGLGGEGNDAIVGGSAADVLDGGAGDDHLSGIGGNDVLYGRDGADWLYGVGGNDRLFGEGGLDRLSGGDGDDYLDGGFDGISDRLWGDAGSDVYEAEWRFVPISVRPYIGWVNYDRPIDWYWLGPLDRVTSRGR